MTKLGPRLLLALCLGPLGCRAPTERDPAPPGVPIASAPASSALIAAEPPARQGAAPRAGVDWEALVGSCVVAEGYAASGAKTGPTLLGGGWTIAIVPKGTQSVPTGARLRVRGVVAVRNNSAVFAQRPGEPVRQGIPAPEGMAVEGARRQTVIEQAIVTAVRSRAEVERALADALGKDVSLPGVVWSLNGHYWFNHDGVELHVEGQHALPEWSSLQGKVVSLRGKLTRRPMPRISQFALDSKPDLADAFVLSLTGASEPTDLNVMPCPK